MYLILMELIIHRLCAPLSIEHPIVCCGVFNLYLIGLSDAQPPKKKSDFSLSLFCHFFTISLSIKVLITGLGYYSKLAIIKVSTIEIMIT